MMLTFAFVVVKQTYCCRCVIVYNMSGDDDLVITLATTFSYFYKQAFRYQL